MSHKPPAASRLSAQEIKVLKALSTGKSKEEAAKELHLSVGTIRTHINSLMPKTGAHRLEHATAVAIARGELVVKQHDGEPEPRLDKETLNVLIGIARGKSLLEIQKDYNLTQHEIRNHVRLLRSKLGAQTRPHLVYRGFETGNLVINRRKQQ